MELRLINSHTSEPRFAEVRATPVELTSMGIYSHAATDKDPEFIGTYGVIRDITDKKRSEALMHYHEYHDQLTGLPNRALFYDRLKMAIAQARRSNSMIGILFLDIDRFTLINDSLGHLAGDKILQQITARLSTSLREEDTLARVSGDEFLMLLPNINSRDAAAYMARQIIAGCKNPMCYEDQELLLTFSIGIATFPEHGQTKDDLIHNAYLAKCYMKQNGRNGYKFYQTSFRGMENSILKTETALRYAIQHNELELYYQPQIDIIRNVVTGLEALIRWHHPHKGMLSPGAFIPLAEQSSLICDLGQWVLERACEDALKLEERGLTGLKIAINTSMQQLEHGFFKTQVLEAATHYKIRKNQLEIELTENNIMQDMHKTVRILNELDDNNIGVAIDDFGTGYSSLSYLKTLPISTLKVDRSFICDLTSNRSSPPIVSAILAVAAALGVKCIAEGVETSEQRTILQLAGCRTIQGYHFCKPLPLPQIISYLRQAKAGTLNYADQLRLT